MLARKADDANWPPREPSRFVETDHFEDCFEDDMRFIERDMVDDVIIAGRDYPEQGGPGKIRRKKEIDGVDVVLVIATDHPVLITGWTEVRDWKKAMRTGRWSAEQLRTISAFEDELHKLPPGETP